MKLIVKRTDNEEQPIALHTERGEMLPCQARLRITQEPSDMTRLIVEFYIDDNQVRVEMP